MQGDKNEALKTLEQSKFLTDYLSQINVVDHDASQDGTEIPCCIAFSTRKFETTLISRDLISRSVEFDKLMAKIDNIEHVLKQNIITIKDEMFKIGSSFTHEVQSSHIFREEISKQINNLFPKLIQDINLKHEENTKSLEKSLSTQVEELKRELSIHQRLLENVLENQKIANCQQCLTAPTGSTSSTGSSLSKLKQKSYNTFVKQEIEYSMPKLSTGGNNTRFEQALDPKLHVKEANKIDEQGFTQLKSLSNSQTTIQEPSFVESEFMTQTRSTPSIHTLKKSEQRYILRQNNTNAANLSFPGSPQIKKLNSTAKIKRKLIIDVDLEQEIKEVLSNRSNKQLKR
ncbi:22526_t:CDS:2 [Gigaspora margarita]|uniref:22526_t:CDS:1 n=1 Tax=Gigaspora margarita TaxID=4874 RepID=A0ABN7UJZ5_GIGMA|nr:22526_t:CDS:2 [Gigaspora margarita]